MSDAVAGSVTRVVHSIDPDMKAWASGGKAADLQIAGTDGGIGSGDLRVFFSKKSHFSLLPCLPIATQPEGI